MSAAAVLMFLAENADLIELVVNAVRGGRITKEQATAAILKAMTEASDAEMHREFPGG